jgi:hypothetical protein
MTVALIPSSRPEARILSMRPSSRDGLYALASAWQASNGSTNVRPFTRPPSTAPAASDAGATADAPPPYWPDGPSAA